ncbi:MAG: tripartite tricarboxylate transporter TctB family protein [Hyphomonadaceae bacterium]|jgi:hypothetical protein|nr:tripartite tricarboxylate transporter TctB family protein [Hyphomonadaceae bacterium]
MRLGRDGVAGLIGLAVSLVLLPFAFGLPQLPIVPIGPGFYPAIVLVFMGVACGLLVVQDAVARWRAPVTEPASDGGAPQAYGLVLAAFVVTGAYIFLLPLLGFRMATAFFVAAFQIVIERPATAWQWAVLVLIAVATSAVTYLVFDQYLSVLLPRGRWTGW